MKEKESSNKTKSADYTVKTCYQELNSGCGGHLYARLRDIGAEPLHPNYGKFKLPQRKREGATRIREHAMWHSNPAKRFSKSQSVLGTCILHYLEQALQSTGDAMRVDKLAAALEKQLGDIVADVMIAQHEIKSTKT